MFQGFCNHLEQLHGCNELSLELHEAAEAAFRWSGRNRHSFHRLFLVVCGNGSSRIVNHTGKNTVKMRTGTACFMPAGCDLEFHFEEDTFFLSFHFNLRDGSFREIFPMDSRCRVLEDQQGRISKTLSLLRQENADRVSLCRLKGVLWNWLEEILALAPMESRVPEELSPVWRRLLSFLETEAHACSTLDDFAKVAGMSADTLSRRFSHDFGIPLKRCAMRVLASKAEHLLRRDDLKIRDVSALLHFRDEYYFSRFFKKETGVSPKVFRSFARHGIKE